MGTDYNAVMWDEMSDINYANANTPAEIPADRLEAALDDLEGAGVEILASRGG